MKTRSLVSYSLDPTVYTVGAEEVTVFISDHNAIQFNELKVTSEDTGKSYSDLTTNVTNTLHHHSSTAQESLRYVLSFSDPDTTFYAMLRLFCSFFYLSIKKKRKEKKNCP